MTLTALTPMLRSADLAAAAFYTRRWISASRAVAQTPAAPRCDMGRWH
ncbi:hypothetical protein [Xanthomonas translucens]|nr:hypothetical protein [Xanthomonas translucens]